MRDLETIRLAVEATGHLVFGTLHTTNAPKTVDHVIEVFPQEEQSQIRNMLSTSLKVVMAQNLFKRIDKRGDALPWKSCVYVSDCDLIREGKTFQMISAIQLGKKAGIQSLDEAIVELLNKKMISLKEAYDKCTDKAKFAPFLKFHRMISRELRPMSPLIGCNARKPKKHDPQNEMAS